MTDHHQLLRHFVATLAYRTRKALRGAPADFGRFGAGNGTRTPQQILCHMTSVLGYARARFIGGTYEVELCDAWEEEVRRFHGMLADLSELLEKGEEPSDTTLPRLLQGPLSDAMTHVGQLAMLRRLAGHPVEPEDFIVADIRASNVSEDQPPPVSPGRRDGSGAAPVGPSTSAAGTATRLFGALARKDVATVLALATPEALSELHTQFHALAEQSERETIRFRAEHGFPEPDRIRPEGRDTWYSTFGVDTLEAFRGLSAEEVCRRLIEVTLDQEPARTRAVVGEVLESDDVAHVVYRERWRFQERDVRSIEILTLARQGDSWRAEDLGPLRLMFPWPLL